MEGEGVVLWLERGSQSTQPNPPFTLLHKSLGPVANRPRLKYIFIFLQRDLWPEKHTQFVAQLTHHPPQLSHSRILFFSLSPYHPPLAQAASKSSVLSNHSHSSPNPRSSLRFSNQILSEDKYTNYHATLVYLNHRGLSFSSCQISEIEFNNSKTGRFIHAALHQGNRERVSLGIIAKQTPTLM